MIIKAEMWIECEMRRDVARRHQRNGRKVLIVVEDGKSAPDGDKENREYDENQPLTKRKSNSDIFSIWKDCNQAAKKCQYSGNPKCNFNRSDACQEIGKPRFDHETNTKPNHRQLFLLRWNKPMASAHPPITHIKAQIVKIEIQ